MAKITAAEVNKLRKQTGAGMMDCKNALVENDGDIEKAIDYLRKKGQKVAAKRSDRDAAEGAILSGTNADNSFGAVVMINCETDFVAKNDDFVAFAKSILDVAIENKTTTVEDLKTLTIGGQTIEALILDQVGKIGEKIEIGKFASLNGAYVKTYIHPGNRLATVVAMSKNVDGVDEVSKDIAMQVAAMNPVALNKDLVDKTVIERELEVAKDQIRQEGKPEAMLEKIATGKLNKFFKENTLLSQAFIKDSKIDVETYAKNLDKDLTVSNFLRFALA
ncbi:elongation factor Ts [Lentimicrobium sp. L6]|nr:MULTISPECIES: translation elongation factor Ts [unclassified Lentimicrobium]NPD44474.1 elongation factor Ts [Lentimicrobium sp. S6]NPD84226.1 elongation factor Ts [Lentimicrobium sp. L6]